VTKKEKKRNALLEVEMAKSVRNNLIKQNIKFILTDYIIAEIGVTGHGIYPVNG